MYYVSEHEPPASLYQTESKSIPCTDTTLQVVPCETARVPIADLNGEDASVRDKVIAAAFEKHSLAGFPEELLFVKPDNGIESDLYITQSTLYEQVIVSPGQESTSDSILVGDSLFAAIGVIALLGCTICCIFLYACYTKRNHRAVAFADWRFTCAFILGCAAFNASNLTLVGPNHDDNCVLRLWAFHLCLVGALAPLFVKVWRMKQLVGQTTVRRSFISNAQAHRKPLRLSKA